MTREDASRIAAHANKERLLAHNRILREMDRLRARYPWAKITPQDAGSSLRAQAAEQGVRE